MSDLSRDPFEDAELHGLLCVVPEPDELFLDIDDPKDLDHLDAMLAVFVENGVYAERLKDTRSKSGNRHVYVRFGRTFEPMERIALQACLGSDRKRELLSILRVFNGNKFPTVFYEVRQVMQAKGK